MSLDFWLGSAVTLASCIVFWLLGLFNPEVRAFFDRHSLARKVLKRKQYVTRIASRHALVSELAAASGSAVGFFFHRLLFVAALGMLAIAFLLIPSVLVPLIGPLPEVIEGATKVAAATAVTFGFLLAKDSSDLAWIVFKPKAHLAAWAEEVERGADFNSKGN